MDTYSSLMERYSHGHDTCIVLLPGFQKRLLKEKGREQFWQKKGNLHRTRKNLKNGQNFTTFRVNKMFSHKF
jgi:hypothetical protein